MEDTDLVVFYHVNGRLKRTVEYALGQLNVQTITVALNKYCRAQITVNDVQALLDDVDQEQLHIYRLRPDGLLIDVDSETLPATCNRPLAQLKVYWSRDGIAQNDTTGGSQQLDDVITIKSEVSPNELPQPAMKSQAADQSGNRDQVNSWLANAVNMQYLNSSPNTITQPLPNVTSTPLPKYDTSAPHMDTTAQSAVIHSMREDILHVESSTFHVVEEWEPCKLRDKFEVEQSKVVPIAHRQFYFADEHAWHVPEILENSVLVGDRQLVRQHFNAIEQVHNQDRHHFRQAVHALARIVLHWMAARNIHRNESNLYRAAFSMWWWYSWCASPTRSRRANHVYDHVLPFLCYYNGPDMASPLKTALNSTATTSLIHEPNMALISTHSNFAANSESMDLDQLLYVNERPSKVHRQRNKLQQKGNLGKLTKKASCESFANRAVKKARTVTTASANTAKKKYRNIYRGDTEMRTHCRALIAQGYNIQQAAKELNVCARTIYRWKSQSTSKLLNNSNQHLEASMISID